MPRLADLVAAMEEWYDPRWAENWDCVGLVCGDPEEPVTRVLLAVDPTPEVVDDAVAAGNGGRPGQGSALLVTHHPLLLAGVHGVPADDPKGRLVHRMIRGGVAHLVAHTNADVAEPGVSDALAHCLGLRELRPLQPRLDVEFCKLVTFVPEDAAGRVIDALAAAGAGTLGKYERCAWRTSGVGTFRPMTGARPAIGVVGLVESVPETRVEMVVPVGSVGDAVAALRAAHPYEEPAFDLLSQLPLPSRLGSGRVGTLATATTLAEFTASVAAALPETSWGVRAAGEPARVIRTVAVCGGAGGSFIDQARRAGADAYVTADLRHHVASEAVTERGPAAMALIDAAHWATEAPWLDDLAERLRGRFGTSVDVDVSRRITDPWTVHVPVSSPKEPHR